MAARELMILLAPDSSAWGICAPSSLLVGNGSGNALLETSHSS